MTRLEAAAHTDPGPVRAQNEDAVVLAPERGRFAVIDGMGGQAGGLRAAALAASAIGGAGGLDGALPAANVAVMDAADAEPALRGMGCVATAAEIVGDLLRVVHIGDTRALLVTAAGVEVLTRSHTRAGEALAHAALDDAEVRAIRGGHQVTRDLGAKRYTGDGWFDRVEAEIAVGDLLVLCSDGVHGPIDAGAMGTLLREARAAGTSCEALARALVDEALRRGGKDNATAVVVRALVAEPATTPVAEPGTTRGSGPAPVAAARGPGFGVGLLVGLLLGLGIGGLVGWRAGVRAAAVDRPPAVVEPDPEQEPSGDEAAPEDGAPEVAPVPPEPAPGAVP